MAPHSPATVLCIDDQASGVAIRKKFLETFGYRVLTAFSGREGLSVAAEHAVDAVILDFRMPDMNGDAVARELRSRYPQIPIVLLTGYVHDLPESAQQSVDAVITKGSPPTELLETLKSILKRAPEKLQSRQDAIADPGRQAHVQQHISEVRKQVQKVRDAGDQMAKKRKIHE